jgi:hypothetical protein
VFAAQILAVGGDGAVAEKLRGYKKALAEKVAVRSRLVQQQVEKMLRIPK